MAKSFIQKIAKDVEKKVKKAANSAARKAKKEVIKYIQEHYNVKTSALGDSIKIKYAITRNGVTNVKLVFTGKPLGLYKYGRPQQTARYKSGEVGGTRVTVKKGNRHLFKHAFIATMKSGHTGVFIRTEGNKSLPIRELYGPNTIQLFDMTGPQEYMEEVFFKEFDKEFDRLMKL